MRVLRGGGGERHRGHRSVIYAGDVGGAVEWREIKLKTSCDVPAPLNQRRTTILDQRAPTFVPTLVSFPDPKPFPKMLPTLLYDADERDISGIKILETLLVLI